ncbi:MAG: LysR family transcriptional regulator [Micropruina sp.]|uniref:LysR family transcriptional regulator n=1 Tax=Micropruina sp. TaxID=2737536 RepID=UPI0039E43378
MMDLQRLRIYRAVVAAGSIQGAAANLGYTPSAVSQQVAALARETGLVLLSKAGRGVEPTDAGLELATAADGLFGELSEVEARVTDLREGRAGSLSMAYFTSAAMAWIPAIVRRVLDEHPRLRLDLRVQELPCTDEQRVDVEVLVGAPGFTAPAGFGCHHLMDEPYVAVLPPGHRFAGHDAVELADLADERWIAHDSEQSWCVINLRRAAISAGFTPPYSVRTANHPTAIAFVAAGIGIAVMPRLCTIDLPDGVRTVDLVNPTPIRSVHVLVRRAVEQSPAVQLVVGGLLAKARASVHPAPALA